MAGVTDDLGEAKGSSCHVLTKCLHNKLGQSAICGNANSSTNVQREETGHGKTPKRAGREKVKKELGWTLPRRAMLCIPPAEARMLLSQGRAMLTHLSMMPPESPLRPRLGARESSSSKKIMQGTAALALAKTGRRQHNR